MSNRRALLGGPSTRVIPDQYTALSAHPPCTIHPRATRSHFTPSTKSQRTAPHSHQVARCTEMHGSQRYTSVADGALALEIINVTATKAGELSAAPVDASGRHGQVCISMLRLTVISRRCSRGAVDGLG